MVLSPAVKSGPKLTPSSSPLTEEGLNRKLKEAEDRRKSLDNLRYENLSCVGSWVIKALATGRGYVS